MAPLLPIGLHKARTIGLGGAAVVSLFGVLYRDPSKIREMGGELALWP